MVFLCVTRRIGRLAQFFLIRRNENSVCNVLCVDPNRIYYENFSFLLRSPVGDAVMMNALEFCDVRRYEKKGSIENRQDIMNVV